MGGADKVAKQHAKGKLSARERVDKLFDPGTFVEIGMLATHHVGGEPTDAPADGVICGTGKIEGRMAACAAYDFTIFGGSIGRSSETKVTRMREIATKQRIPMIWLIDSAGARIGGQTSGDAYMISYFTDSGYLFREQVTMSGVVPQVCAMVGPGAAGTAYIPGLADFVPMVKGTSSMALGGPALVKAATSEEISEEDLGGSKIHTTISGNADLEVANDDECIRLIREYLAFFPSNCQEKPPRKAYTPKDSERLPDSVLDLLPDNPRGAWDMHTLIKVIVDDGYIFEMKPKWARNLITTFARIAGRPVGIVANNPKFMGGILDVNSADKAARFINLCYAFNIPLVFLEDVPGFIIGSKVEKEGIIRHGAKMLFAVSRATVPKLTVIVRKAYGAGYYVMCGRAFEPDLFVGWPTAEISVMGPEGMVGIAGKKLMANIPPEQQEAVKQMIVDGIKKHINPYAVSGYGFLDDVIDPRETRQALIRGLEMTENKTVERPWRKHGVEPV